jgi:GalNAc5-diNAcBac-PP-undecaprenol beta-1,3-glucosyltransferase
MATYNRAHFIVETLEAIHKQTFKDWECLIIDDGGTDNTLEVISPMLEDDSRFTFLKRPDTYAKGLPGCRNYGLDIAKGDFIIFFDDDDIPHPENLEICQKELASEEYKFCRYLRAVFTNDFDYNFDAQENYTSFEIATRDIAKMIDHTLPFNSCAVMWTKDCFEGIRFNESLMYAEEWECYSRILSEEIKGICIEKTLFYGRKHSNSNTGEFWNQNPIRLNSKKNAIRLITKTLTEKGLLSTYLFKYLMSLALSFRDRELLDDLVKISKPKIIEKAFVYFKYEVYPMWVYYNRLTRR